MLNVELVLSGSKGSDWLPASVALLFQVSHMRCTAIR